MTATDLIDVIRAALSRYVFVPQNEAELQSQVSDVLSRVLWAGTVIEREYIAERGRYDILVRLDGISVVLELKVKGSANEVERQAQRYALTDGVDAVAVVTTKQRLASELATAKAQARGIRDPNVPSEAVLVGAAEDHIKRLAEDVLRRSGTKSEQASEAA